MKLLLDENLSRKLVTRLSELFPDTSHVALVMLEHASDEEIWKYAKENNFVIVTQDADFHERLGLYGFPPKIIWLRLGNSSTSAVEAVLREHAPEIVALETDEARGGLIIQG